MLTRRFRRGQEADTGRGKTMAQDGFSATIEGPVPAVSPRPWHDDTTPFTPISEEMIHQMKYGAAAAQNAQSAPQQAARGAYRAPAGFSTVGRHVLDFADNGDGTLTLVRCIDPQTDDLDIQFEAGACPVTAIAPKAFEGCAALARVVLPQSLKQIGEAHAAGDPRLCGAWGHAGIR